MNNEEEKEILNTLIIGIKREKKELIESLVQRNALKNEDILLTGIYLCIRFKKSINYPKLREHLSMMREKQMIKSRESKIIYEDILESENNSSFLISGMSESYKRLMLRTLNYAIYINEVNIISFIIKDEAMIIDSKLIYILLKHQLYYNIEEIILQNIQLRDDTTLGFEYPHRYLYLQLQGLTNINLGSGENKRINVGCLVDFMIQNEFDDILIHSFILRMKHLEDLSVIPILLQNQKEKWAEKLIKEGYSYSDYVLIIAIQHDCFFFLLFYIKLTQGELIEYENDILQCLIHKIKSDPKHIEIYLYFLYKFLSYISFLNSKNIFIFLEDSLHSNDNSISFLFGQPNPIKILILFIEIVLMLISKYPNLRTKGEKIKLEMISVVKHVQDQIDNENTMRQIFYDKEIQNREVIFIIGSRDLIEIEENKNMQSIINDIWIGPFILESNLISSTSSLFKLLQMGITSKRDNELLNRPHMLIRQITNMKSHPFQFVSWRDGIQARYFFETFMFFLIFLTSAVSSTMLLADSRIMFKYNEKREQGIILSPQEKEEYEDTLEKLILMLNITYALVFFFSILFYHYIFSFIFLILAKRHISWKIFIHIEFLVDVILVILSRYFLIQYGDRYADLMESHNRGDSMTVQAEYLVAFFQVNYLDIVLSLLIFFNAMRVLLTLRVTALFGPIVKMIKLMVYSMSTFLFLYMLNLWTFAIMGAILMFDAVKANRFESVYNSFITLFQASLGVLTLDDTNAANDEVSYSKHTFMICFLLINMVLLMNFLIAILSNIYSIYEARSSSLYMIEIIKLQNMYKTDDTYGCLIAAPNPISIPFNCISMMLYLGTLPFDNRTTNHKKINNFMLHIQFSLVFLLELAIYMSINAILFPLVYLKWIFTKIVLIFNGNERTTKKRILESVLFVFLGLFILLFNYFSDMYYFTIHSYKGKPEHIFSTKKTDYIQQNLYLKLLEFLKVNKEEQMAVAYSSLINKVKELCGVKDINLMTHTQIDQEYIMKEQNNRFIRTITETKRVSAVVSRKEPRSDKIHTNKESLSFLEAMGIKANSDEFEEKRNSKEIMFEGQESMSEERQREYIERIHNFVSISKLIKNIAIKNKEGVEVVNMELLYTLLYVHIRMSELQQRMRLLGKVTNEELINQKTYANFNSRASVVKSMKIRDLENSGSTTKGQFLKEHVLMTLLHAYEFNQLTKGIIFFKSENEQPLKINSIIKNLNLLNMLIAKHLARETEELGASSNKKLEEKRSFENEIESRTLYEDETKWKDIVQNISIKPPREKEFSISSEDISQDESHFSVISNRGEKEKMRFMGGQENKSDYPYLEPQSSSTTFIKRSTSKGEEQSKAFLTQDDIE